MALIVVRLTFRQARSQGQDGSRPIRGLDLTLLIHAQHQSSIRRVEVKSHHIAHLLLELRVVGNLELFHPVRLHVMALPDAVHPHARNPQLLSEPAHAPVGSIRRPRLHRGIQDLLLQLCGQDAPRSLALLRLAQSLRAAAAESKGPRHFSFPFSLPTLR